MTGLDTNILVRYFTQDDPIQSKKANEIIERRLTEDEPGFVSVVTIVETVWDLSNLEIAAAVEGMLQSDTLVIQNEQEVFTAVAALKAGRGSFADALVSALGTWAGCVSTLTFDSKAGRLDGFEVI
jgi:predicted nucleic-acid-binding protein